jgi:vacuolar-type H+-ATPase subunit H
MAATTAAVVGIVSGVAGTAMSFAQAAKQQQNIRAAQAKADQAMQEARKKLEVNYFDQLAIQKEPYELQREALLSSGAQAIQAAQEGDRGAAAAAGRVQMAQNEAQAGVRTAMGKELSDLERLSATEESRLRDIGVQLDMGEIAGAQQAMSDAEQAKAAAMAQGFQGIGNIANAVDKFVPLYPGGFGGKKEAGIGGSIAGASGKTNASAGAGAGGIDWNKKSSVSNFGGGGYSAYNPYDLFPTLENVNRQGSMWDTRNNMNSPSIMNLNQPNYNAINYRQNLPNYVYDYTKLNERK